MFIDSLKIKGKRAEPAHLEQLVDERVRLRSHLPGRHDVLPGGDGGRVAQGQLHVGAVEAVLHGQAVHDAVDAPGLEVLPQQADALQQHVGLLTHAVEDTADVVLAVDEDVDVGEALAAEELGVAAVVSRVRLGGGGVVEALHIYLALGAVRDAEDAAVLIRALQTGWLDLTTVTSKSQIT